MKTTVFIFIALAVTSFSIAQTSYKKQPTIGVQFIFNDFQTATDIINGGITKVLRDKQWLKLSRMSPGLAITYLEGLDEKIDFAGTVSGSFADNAAVANNTSDNKNFLLEAAATINIKLVSDKYWVSPFVTIGAGVSNFNSGFGAFIPVGLGLQVNVYDQTYILLNSQYRMRVTENVNYHFYHSIGIAGNIFTRKKLRDTPPAAAPL